MPELLAEFVELVVAKALLPVVFVAEEHLPHPVACDRVELGADEFTDVLSVRGRTGKVQLIPLFGELRVDLDESPARVHLAVRR